MFSEGKNVFGYQKNKNTSQALLSLIEQMLDEILQNILQRETIIYYFICSGTRKVCHKTMQQKHFKGNLICPVV